VKKTMQELLNKQAAEREALERELTLRESLRAADLPEPAWVHVQELYGTVGSLVWLPEGWTEEGFGVQCYGDKGTLEFARKLFERFPAIPQQVVRKGWVTVSPAFYGHGKDAQIEADIECAPIVRFDPNTYADTRRLKLTWPAGVAGRIWRFEVSFANLGLGLFVTNMRRVEFRGGYRWERTGSLPGITWNGPRTGQEVITYASGSDQTLPTALVYWPPGTLDGEGIFNMLKDFSMEWVEDTDHG